MDLLCAECIINHAERGSELNQAEAMIDGTALCQSHAKNLMEKVVEARKGPGNFGGIGQVLDRMEQERN